MRRAAAAALVLAAGASTSPSRADVRADADRLEASWRASGARASRLAPVFVEHDRAAVVRLPAPLVDAARPGCLTVAVIGVRAADLSIAADVAARDSAPEARSVEGIAAIARCGAARASLASLAIELRAGRAALELVAAEADAPAPDVDGALPERARGPVASLVDPGPSTTDEPAAARVARLEGRARREGATSVDTRLDATNDGAGRTRARLDVGCHDLWVVPDAAGGARADVDVDLVDAATRRPLSRDHGMAREAHVALCTGQGALVDVVHAGAPRARDAWLVDVREALPDALDAALPARARAGLASALRRRGVALSSEPPWAKLAGVAGATRVAVPIASSGCYVAAVAMTTGEARSLSLVATVGHGARSDASTPATGEGTAVAFCARGYEVVTLDVDARAAAGTWALAMFRAPETRATP